ncbi:hypothetical protein P4571_08265 [Niallia alba]|uniref:hypothetical protein n=1 Tax=Niallia alba TaxID=2729105 RepID=UPI002E1EE69D|nr:hypothetical protein [Niallia alba]
MFLSKINFKKVIGLLKGFCLGAWTTLLIAMNSYAYIDNDRGLMFFCSILLACTFFVFGLILGEFSRNKKVRGEVKIEVD